MLGKHRAKTPNVIVIITCVAYAISLDANETGACEIYIFFVFVFVLATLANEMEINNHAVIIVATLLWLVIAVLFDYIVPVMEKHESNDYRILYLYRN